MFNTTSRKSYGPLVVPGIFSLRTSLGYASLLGISCYLFLIIFQPFGTYNFEDSSKYLLLAGYGVIFAFSYLLASLLLSSGRQWTLKKEYLRMLLVYISATILNFLYNSFVVSHVPVQWINLMYMGFYTLSLHVPIGLIYFLAVLKTNSDKPFVSIEDQDTPIQPTLLDSQGVISENHKHVTIVSGSQCLQFGKQDFIFAKSMDNYCEVYFCEGKITKKEIVRITLGKLADQLMESNIHRCHRSYLVNFDKILTKEGNAQGFLLHFEGMEECALVSRSMLPFVKSYLPD
ncbi:MAG: LytTR family transcriptional regulator [Sphingobacterium sp.]|jgi:hypothetical protein|nr:LytTR family transcriptional regulator [Sphingobacterium sp.]